MTIFDINVFPLSSPADRRWQSPISEYADPIANQMHKDYIVTLEDGGIQLKLFTRHRNPEHYSIKPHADFNKTLEWIYDGNLYGDGKVPLYTGSGRKSLTWDPTYGLRPKILNVIPYGRIPGNVLKDSGNCYNETGGNPSCILPLEGKSRKIDTGQCLCEQSRKIYTCPQETFKRNSGNYKRTERPGWSQLN